MSLTKASFSMITGAPFNILDYGADASGVNDSTTAIQAAITACAVSGGAVYIPAGTYKITSFLSVPYGVSIYGAGATASILNCNSCDGIHFTSFGYQIGSMFYQDFGLTASSGSNYAAIVTNTNASTQDGLYLNRLRFYGWNQCIVLRSDWNCTISECVGQNINQGIELAGSSGTALGIRIINNRFTYASGGSGSASPIGINLSSASSVTESIHILSNQIYGFATNIYIGVGLFVNIIDNDLSGSSQVIYAIDPRGGYNICDNYIEVTGTGTGLYMPSVNTQNLQYRTTIQNNNFVGNGSAPAYGLDIGEGGGNYQWEILIDNNTFVGFHSQDIRIIAPGYTTITNNRCVSTLTTYSILFDTIYGPPVIAANNLCEKSIYVSNVADYTGGKLVLTNNVENNVFQSNKQSASPTTGTWRVTDVVMNSAPTVGQPKGWVCTVAGTPGTWVSLGNL